MSLEEGSQLLLSAPFIGNPIPDVVWLKDGNQVSPSERVLLTCDGRKVINFYLPNFHFKNLDYGKIM